jgi:lipopolysaccharide export system permease protein
LTSWRAGNTPVRDDLGTEVIVNRLDRYILAQLLGPFGFFALVFTGIIWLTQALALIDRVIASNQSALVFLEFSALILPRVLTMVLPLSAFAAAIYAVNRLYLESELFVIMAAGRSYARMLVPFLVFGMIVAGLVGVLTLYLVPVSATRLADRIASFRTQITNSFVSEGEFIHPVSGVTIFVRDASRSGEMEGLFLHDQRDAENPATYVARRALVLDDGAAARLVMFDGIVQTTDTGDGSFSAVRFDQFTYELGDLVKDRAARRRSAREYFLPDLLDPTAAMLTGRENRSGDFISEGHSQLVLPLLALIYPAFAFACLVWRPFRRGTLAFRIGATVLGGAAIQMLAIVAKSFVRTNPGSAATSYLPVILALAVALAMLIASGRPRRRAATGGLPA